MTGITNLSHTSNKAIIEAAILLTLALAAILIIHKFQHVSAGSPNQGHSVLLNASNDTGSTNSSSPADSGSGGSSNSNTTKVTVNGQDIPVPQNGASSQTVDNPGGGTTQVDTSNQQSSSNSSGTASNHSSTTINVNSSSSSNSNQGGSQ